jgi:hypothetical protein
MKTVWYGCLLVGLLSACAPAFNGPVVPIEAGKDPACVKGCASKQKDCVSGAKHAASSLVSERCYDGYEICVRGCQPI